jgi:hypothetical protein
MKENEVPAIFIKYKNKKNERFYLHQMNVRGIDENLNLD